MAMLLHEMNERQLFISDFEGHRFLCTLYFTTRPPWTMKLASTVFESEFIEANDLFECLRIARKNLEERGYKVLCKGAKKNVHPSSLQREMTGGLSAYELTMENFGKSERMVNIFDEAEPEEVDTVDCQLEYYQRWLNRLRKRSD